MHHLATPIAVFRPATVNQPELHCVCHVHVVAAVPPHRRNELPHGAHPESDAHMTLLTLLRSRVARVEPLPSPSALLKPNCPVAAPSSSSAVTHTLSLCTSNPICITFCSPMGLCGTGLGQGDLRRSSIRAPSVSGEAQCTRVRSLVGGQLHRTKRATMSMELVTGLAEFFDQLRGFKRNESRGSRRSWRCRLRPRARRQEVLKADGFLLIPLFE